MPAATCPAPEMPPVTMWQSLIERAHELELWIDTRPASPAQREAWLEELELVDAELCEAGIY